MHGAYGLCICLLSATIPNRFTRHLSACLGDCDLWVAKQVLSPQICYFKYLAIVPIGSPLALLRFGMTPFSIAAAATWNNRLIISQANADKFHWLPAT
jgi:hypothetical protein